MGVLDPVEQDVPFRWYCFFAWDRLHGLKEEHSEEQFMKSIVWC